MAETSSVAPPATPPTRDGRPSVPPAVVKKTTLGIKKRKVGPWAAGLAILLLGFVFYWFFLRAPAAAPLIIRYAAIDTGTITRGVTATGTLQATTTVQVGSQVSGLVKRIFADYNTHVRRGQLLAVLDTAPYVASLTQSAATETKARSDLALAISNEMRERKLLAEQLISQQEYDQSINALRDARATVSQDSAQYEQARVNLNYTFIRSPVDGVVQARNVDSGQTVAAGLNVTVLYVIAEDLTKMQVAAAVDEADIGEVAVGQSVKFTVEAYPGQDFVGTVSQVRINPVTTANVVTYTVIITTNNPDGKLLPGMTATVNIINASRENVLRIPVAATRFVPPPELIAELPASAQDSARHRGPRPAGDTAHHHHMMTEGTGAAAVQPSFATIYRKTKGPKGDQFEPVHVVTGLSDANDAELLRSNPQLKVGDSVVVAAFTMSATPQSSSPYGQQRPGGGGPRGGR